MKPSQYAFGSESMDAKKFLSKTSLALTMENGLIETPDFFIAFLTVDGVLERSFAISRLDLPCSYMNAARSLSNWVNGLFSDMINDLSVYLSMDIISCTIC